MSDEIVRRLNSKRKSNVDLLKESMSKYRLSEAEDDEEDEEVKDDSTAPEQGKISRSEDSDDSIVDDEDDVIARASEDLSDKESEDDEYVDPEGDTEEDLGDSPETNTDEYTNPLDNNYAVKHTIGDEVLLAYSNGTKSKLKGEIDGYDKEGFYRIRWSNGLTTNGITDLALADLVSPKTESTCVCGSSKFVNEGKNIVCDRCGRRIREAVDPLTLADKSRPKGKKLIRSEAHPVSTVMKPSISEAIKKALKGTSSLDEDHDEDYDEDYDEDVFAKLKTLDGEFWTRLPELKEDIEDLGYTVDEINNEYVVVSIEDEEGEDYGLLIPIGGTSRTMTLDISRAREV